MIHQLPEIKLGLRGFFTVELIDAKSGLIKRRLEFPNLITDAGLDALGNGVQLGQLINSYMGVGTGSAAPGNSDTALVTEIAPAVTHRTTSNGGIAEVYGSGPSYAYWYRRITRLFSETQANGNLTELGLFTTSSAGTMFVRQLFKDALLAPTTITKTSADQLRVTYEIRLYSPTVDVTVNPFAVSGVNYSVTTRAFDIANGKTWGQDNSIFAVMTSFRSTGLYASAIATNVLYANADPLAFGTTIAVATSNSTAGYVSGTFYADLTTVFDPGIANFAGGVGSLIIGTDGGPGFQQAFTPKLPKDNTKRLTIVNRISWARYP